MLGQEDEPEPSPTDTEPLPEDNPEPDKLYCGLVDLDKGTVELNGSRLEDAFFDIQMADSIPEDTTASEPVLWKIYVDSITIDRSDVVFHMPGDTMSINAHLGHLAAREALIDLGSQTYTVGSVDWLHGAVKYDQNFQPHIEGLDYNHIDLSDISVGIDSIYYHDPTMRMYLRQVALKEKSGLAVTHLSGPIAMVDGAIKLPKFRLSTPYSDIDLELDMPLSLMEPVDPGKMRLKMNASLGKQDIMPFMADLPVAMRQRWPEYPLTVCHRPCSIWEDWFAGIISLIVSIAAKALFRPIRPSSEKCIFQGW